MSKAVRRLGPAFRTPEWRPSPITGRGHVWTGSTRQFCERCGMDKPAVAEQAARKDCHPTNLGGGIGGW